MNVWSVQRRTLFLAALGGSLIAALPSSVRAKTLARSDSDMDALKLVAAKVRRFVREEAETSTRVLIQEAAIRLAVLGSDVQAFADVVHQDFELGRTIDIHEVCFSHTEIALLLTNDEGKVSWLVS